MEHYFLVLSSGPFSAEEQLLVKDHVTNLLPSQNCQVKSILPLLRCSSVNIAAVDKYSSEHQLCWTPITEGLSVDDVLTTAFSSIGTNPEKSVLKCVYSLHILADNLPSRGTYHLDIIVNDLFAKSFDLKPDLPLANALYRLFKYHGACTSLISTGNVDKKEIENLSVFSDLRVIRKEDNANFGPLAWRGCWQFQDSHNKITTLSMAHEMRLSKSDAELMSGECDSSQYSDHLDSTHIVLSPILQSLALCRFASIPPYLFLPVKFNMYLYDNVFCSPTNYPFMQMRNSEVCVVTRLGFDYLDRKPAPDAALSSSKWCKTISMTNIKFPESSYPTVGKYLTLAFKPSCQHMGVLEAYPLYSPDSLNAEEFFPLVDQLIIKRNLSDPKNDLDDKTSDDCDIPDVPYVDADKMIEFIKTEAETHGNKVCDFSQRIKSFMKSAASGCKPFTFQNDIRVTKDETDPSDWPERLCLLKKQLKEEKEKNYKHNNFLKLSPQRNQFTFSFTCYDATKYFDSSGKAKNSALEVITMVNGKSNHLRSTLKAPEEIKYTDKQNYPFSDVYYNINNTTEEKESMANEHVRLFVSHETATTCNKQQANPNCLITVKKKINTPKKSYKSPGKLSENEEIMRKKFAEKVKGVIGCKSELPKISFASQKPVFDYGRNQTVAKGTVNRKLFEKRQTLPVRSSPRKKKPVQYKVPPRNMTTVPKKKPESTGLPEIIKKKLRVAVASALEDNGISFDDPFFKPCGKRLFVICQTFVQDITHKKGSMSEYMQKIADAHVKQVIEFERQKEI